MEISFERLIALFLNKLKFILLISVIAAVAAYFISENVIDKEYTSSAKMYIPMNQELMQNASSEVTTTRRLVNNYIGNLETYDFFKIVSERVNKELNANLSPAAIKKFTKFTPVSTKEESSHFYIRYTSKSSTLAGDVLNIIYLEAIKSIESRETGYTLECVDKPNGHQTPSAPNTRNNCIYAFMIGFVISVCFFYFREIFDIRIKNVQDILSEYEISLLGVVPNAIPQKVSKSKKSYRGYAHSYYSKEDNNNGK